MHSNLEDAGRNGRRKRIGGILLALALSVGVGSAALAQGWGDGPHGGGFRDGGMGPGPCGPPGGPPGGPRGGEMMPMEFQRLHRLLGALDLTPAQMDEIRSIVESVREEIMDLRERRGEEAFSPSSFAEVFARERLTVEDLEDFFDEGRELREEILEVVLEGLVDIHDVLTEEQLDRIVVITEMAEMPGFGRL